MHTSAHTHTFTHTHEETEQQAVQGRGQHHPFSSTGEHTHVHTWDRDAPALLCLPGRAHTLKRLCKYTGMHAYMHLHETTPMCKSKPGDLCLPRAPPAPCPLHANPPGAELCHKIPSPGPKLPKAVLWAMQSLVWGAAPPSIDSSMPHPMPAWHSRWYQHWL